jgi:hypothetical protein
LLVLISLTSSFYYFLDTKGGRKRKGEGGRGRREKEKIKRGGTH